ncbi:unnamed protein product [Cuscuta campestris]|uniref:Dynein light chain n=1 Tax=Cuscuta campestris TaxID=132261 RepID=A0A484MXW8_9ASTE|nr:unnamed protein product [Cuscuta campestris]
MRQQNSSAAVLRCREAPPDPTIPAAAPAAVRATPAVLRSISATDLDSACSALTKSKSHRGGGGGCKSGPRASSDSLSVGSGGGRRRSFCSSVRADQLLEDVFNCSGVKVVAVDMAPFMQIHAVNFTRKVHDSLEKFSPKALALTLKKEFDGVYGAAWHCIVGNSFGSFVTHSTGGFIYFSMDQKLHVLLFKTSIKKAC